MGGLHSRNKGKRGELEWAKFCDKYLAAIGLLSRRGQQFSGSPDSPDVKTTGLPVHWEVKRVESGNPYNWLEQAIADAGEDRTPIVAHRRNTKEWMCVLRADDLLKLLKLTVCNTIQQNENPK
jgi:hypothetical protein